LPRCHSLRLKCTKVDFGWGSAPGAAYSAPLDPIAGFKGPTSKGKRRRGKEWEGGMKGTRGGEVEGEGIDVA